MKTISRKELIEDALRQIENELKHYANTINQEMFFSVLQEKIKLEKQLENLKEN